MASDIKDGILIVNKPEGISSARVVSRVKKLLGAKKVGHTGTLDPFATGVLPCAVNKGTRISRFFLGGDKQYLAKICLGSETETYDRTGDISRSYPESAVENLSVGTVRKAVASFKGVQDQVPPVYSALKHDGQPLYKLARQGKAVRKPARQIEISRIEVLSVALPYVDIDVTCSGGTYIRSLAFDLGRKLGCGAHLAELCRSGAGQFRLGNAVSLDELEAAGRQAAWESILPLSPCLDFLPKVAADAVMAKKIGFGQPLMKNEVEFEPESPDQFIRVTDDDDELLAIIYLPENGQTYNYSCVFSS